MAEVHLQIECELVRDTNDDSDAKPAKGTFLVGKHCTEPRALTGRGTKGFVAYYEEEERVVFLKDSWIVRDNIFHPELDTYARLRANNVEYVATALAGGEVGLPDIQTTRTQCYSTSKTPPLPRVHSRLVTNLGRPLEDYAEAQELIKAVHCAFEGNVFVHLLRESYLTPSIGHKQAWEKAGILHGDISVANILIDVDSTPDNFRAFLNDWDVCTYKSDICDGPTRYGHTVSSTLL